MNYVSAVYGVVAIIIALDWMLRGRKTFRGQTARHREVEGGDGGGGNCVVSNE